MPNTVDYRRVGPCLGYVCLVLVLALFDSVPLNYYCTLKPIADLHLSLNPRYKLAPLTLLLLPTPALYSIKESKKLHRKLSTHRFITKFITISA